MRSRWFRILHMKEKIIKLALNNLEGYICQQSLNKAQKASVIRPRKELILLQKKKKKKKKKHEQRIYTDNTEKRILNR